jgi:gas vesicle protein
MEVRATYSNELLCFLVGGLTGAALALLWAPQSGNSTRAMRGRTRDTGGSARELKDRVVRGAAALVGNDAGPATRNEVSSPR